MEATRVLIVDDSTLMEHRLSSMVGAAGYDVRSCSTLAAGLKLSESFKPALVLVDVLLPVELHSDAGRRVQEALARFVGTVPLISSQHEPVLARLAQRYGVSGHLSKREGPERFLEQLRALLPPLPTPPVSPT